MNILEKTITRFNSVLLWAAAIVMLAAMAIAVVNMIGRPFKSPVQGSFELMGLASAVIAAFALGYTQEKKNHIAVDILFKHFPPRVQRVLDAISNLTCAIFFGLAAYRMALFGLKLKTTGEVSETLGIVTYPFVFCVMLGLVALSLTLLVETFGGFTPAATPATSPKKAKRTDSDG